jgi:hypothetical protein
MILHLKLNGDATDASGNGHHGTPIDISWVAGKIGQAASFNGSSKIDCGSQLDLSGSMTYSLWINPTTISGSLLSQEGYYTGNFKLYFSSSTTLRFLRWIGSGSSVQLWQVPHSLSSGNWVHIVVTYDGMNTRNFYINGVLHVDGSVSTTTQSVSTSNLRIGSDFNGQIDDVRMWRRALTVDEIKAIYNFGDGTEVADPLIATGIYPVLKPSIVRGVSE